LSIVDATWNYSAASSLVKRLSLTGLIGIVLKQGNGLRFIVTLDVIGKTVSLHTTLPPTWSTTMSGSVQTSFLVFV
jgi:hypothetical protein